MAQEYYTTFDPDDQVQTTMIEVIEKNDEAIRTKFSGPTEPTSNVVPYQSWMDTTTGILKIRNATNTAWVDVYDVTNETSVVASGAITETKIALGAVTNNRIADAAVTESKLDTYAVTGGPFGKIALTTITQNNIADGEIVEEKLGTGAVTTTKIFNNSVTEAKIDAGAVTESKIGLDAVTTDRIHDGAVTEGKLAVDSVATGSIQNEAVTNDKLGPASVTNAKIASYTVSAGKLATDAVTEGKIANGAVTESKIGTGAVTGGPTGKLALYTITDDNMSTDSVHESSILDFAVGETKINDAAVTENKIGSQAVTTNKIADTARKPSLIDSESINPGSCSLRPTPVFPALPIIDYWLVKNNSFYNLTVATPTWEEMYSSRIYIPDDATNFYFQAMHTTCAVRVTIDSTSDTISDPGTPETWGSVGSFNVTVYAGTITAFKIECQSTQGSAPYGTLCAFTCWMTQE